MIAAFLKDFIWIYLTTIGHNLKMIGWILSKKQGLLGWIRPTATRAVRINPNYPDNRII